MFDLKESATVMAFNSFDKKKNSMQKRSKLESYIDILMVLIHNGSIETIYSITKLNLGHESIFEKQLICFQFADQQVSPSILASVNVVLS